MTNNTPRNITVVLSLMVVIIVAGSCSWITDFAIANQSSNSIEIAYQFKLNQSMKADHPCSYIKQHAGPAEGSVREIGRFKTIHWNELAADEYSFDYEECRISLEIPPGVVVRIAKVGTYTGHDSNRGRFFTIDSLTIVSEKGRLAYQGMELLHRFKKIKDSLYVLNYGQRRAS